MLCVITSNACVWRFLQEKFVEWDATEAARFIVQGIQDVKNRNRAQNYTMLHFIEVFKGTFVKSGAVDFCHV